jgi:hypothetical protein
MFSSFFFEKRALYGMSWKNILQPENATHDSRESSL